MTYFLTDVFFWPPTTIRRLPVSNTESREYFVVLCLRVEGSESLQALAHSISKRRTLFFLITLRST